MSKHTLESQMKERAPRNRTLTITSQEKEQLMSKVLTPAELNGNHSIENRVIFSDLFDCIDTIPKNFIDLLIVDPPYNLDKQFGTNKFSKLKSHMYEEWVESWINKIKPALKTNASIYVCCDWQSSPSIYKVLQNHFIIRNRITWEREKGRGALTNWKNCSEDIWFCTTSDDYFFDVEAVKLKRKVIAPYKDSEGVPKDWEDTGSGKFRLTHPSNMWTDITIPFWSMPENTDHPTQKPEKLIAKLILASSKEGAMVFDPFLGSGTTAVVAKKLKRQFCGIEREAEYCQMAVKRLELAELDQTIQGYSNGYFWERNSLSEQNKPPQPTKQANLARELF